MSAPSAPAGLALRPAEDVLSSLPPDTLPGTRLVVEWFAAMSAGRFNDAWALMVPDGSFWMLRRRNTLTIAEFGKIMTDLVGTAFAQPIKWKLGLITEQEERVAVVVESYAPLIAGGAYENLYHFLFRIENGLIRDGYEFVDTLRSSQTFAAPPGQS